MKDPAFLFYPADWLTGTMGMTFEQKGAYMELLVMQFSVGHMEHHMIGQQVGRIWEGIRCKFIQDDQGRWYNERLEVEQLKRQKYSESRRNNLKGINQYTKNDGEKEVIRPTIRQPHMAPHMINVNKDVNKDVNKPVKNPVKKFAPPTEPDLQVYFQSKGMAPDQSTLEASKFWNFYESKGWLIGKNKMQKWKSAAANWYNTIKESKNESRNTTISGAKSKITPDDLKNW